MDQHHLLCIEEEYGNQLQEQQVAPRNTNLLVKELQWLPIELEQEQKQRYRK